VEINETRVKAIQRAYQKDERVPLGVYYKVNLPTYDQYLKQNLPTLRDYAPIDVPFHDEHFVPTTNLTSAFEDIIL
jgi:hypothetical protein